MEIYKDGKEIATAEKELALKAWEDICSDYNIPETRITAPKIVYLPINNTTKKVLTNYWEE